MLDEALLFVKRNMRTKTIISPTTGRERTDRTDYPITAVEGSYYKCISTHIVIIVFIQKECRFNIMFEDKLKYIIRSEIITIDQLEKLTGYRNPVYINMQEYRFNIMFEGRIEIHNQSGLYGRMLIGQLGKIQPDTESTLETLGIIKKASDKFQQSDGNGKYNKTTGILG